MKPMHTRLTALLVATLLTGLALPGAFASNAHPVPGVDIIVRKKPGTTAHRTASGRDGRFTVEGLEPGTYEITIEGVKPVLVTLKGRCLTGEVTTTAEGGKTTDRTKIRLTAAPCPEK